MAGNPMLNDEQKQIIEAVEADPDLLRRFVIARCVQLGRGSDATAMKALEMIGRLALGDVPPAGTGYTNQIFDPAKLPTHELEAMLAAVEDFKPLGGNRG